MYLLSLGLQNFPLLINIDYIYMIFVFEWIYYDYLYNLQNQIHIQETLRRIGWIVTVENLLYDLDGWIVTVEIKWKNDKNKIYSYINIFKKK